MRTPQRPKRRTLIAALAGLSLVAAACGSDDADTSDETDTTEAASADSEAPDTEAPDTAAPDTEAPDTAAPGSEPATSEAADTDGEASSEAPERVVSLSPTHTEIMFAIGAGDLLVAIDENSNYPAEALDVPHDLSGFEPNVEAIAGYEPDLVLIGGDFNGLGDQLGELEIESWDGPAASTFDDTYTQIEQLGAITGHVAEAAELVSEMQTSIDEIVAETPAPEAPLSYYHELGPELFTATSTTFIGEVYGIFGLENIADPLEADAGQYPQLSAETLVEANPELIFLADTKCCGESAETVAARDGFDTIVAVQNGNVIELDDDVASRWGPRIVDYIETVSSAVEQASVPAG
ncbi:ABC transporter substrate-binding protein [Ilumatobacter nonamiensis]|uniref:ABC transporter substrate-binding protein n=1 Tax=Ilumatobacter nonamiensis TaxID=467093 RepID=UPI0009FF1ECE|nr:ABC transporter substrate-binding protein [Ilumatobacter nonamiensis]